MTLYKIQRWSVVPGLVFALAASAFGSTVVAVVILGALIGLTLAALWENERRFRG